LQVAEYNKLVKDVQVKQAVAICALKFAFLFIYGTGVEPNPLLLLTFIGLLY
jgi:hypothetical protein